MAVRKIVKMGDELLRKKCKKVTVFDEKLGELLDDMKETMYEFDGMGLAAPQVGVLKRVVVMEVNNMFFELINPEIIASEGEDLEQEACLSCGKIREYVKRPKKVTVKAQDRFGYEFVLTGEKWLARCICHELDHLDGVLFVDRAEKRDKK
ncbi:MAG: peptide deformylase [Clostridiales bacterium]|nr:peptide deformylase [Clostridiales bacterium]